MTIPPVYWSLLGEIALVIIGVLGAVIILVLKDRKKLNEYSLYLKSVIKKLKKKLQEHEDEQNQERVLALLTALIEHVRVQYQTLFGNTIVPEENDSETDNTPSVEKFIFIAGFQTMTAQLSALENSNDPETAWSKIQNELTPLFNNYLAPVLAANSSSLDSDDSLQTQLDNANKRIENLQQFKQLYFDLQAKLSNSVADIEALNYQLEEAAQDSDSADAIRLIIEKNKTHYLEMGQMIGMDKEHHHESVASSMDYSEAIINERKDEIKRLKHQIAQQFEDIWSLQKRMSGTSGEAPAPEELNAGIETISRNLKDAEMCIETMDMEIQTLTSEISNLKHQLKDKSSAPADAQQVQAEQETIMARHAQESKEMMNCITGLEDDNQSQCQRIKELEEKLASGSEFKEKYLQLQAEYSAMEAKYLDVMSK